MSNDSDMILYPNVYRSRWDKINEFFTGKKVGCLQKIDLTFGGAGNQFMTINGKRYATWIDYKEWPRFGDLVIHQPYRSHGMRCTKILEVHPWMNNKK